MMILSKIYKIELAISRLTSCRPSEDGCEQFATATCCSSSLALLFSVVSSVDTTSLSPMILSLEPKNEAHEYATVNRLNESVIKTLSEFVGVGGEKKSTFPQ